MKIGFFGDSFCSCITHPAYSFTTYIKLLQDHYYAELVNLGLGGSSIYDLLILQLMPFIESNTVPDICVFTWTEPHRVFHRQIRNITAAMSLSTDSDPIIQAAKQYYLNLDDGMLDVLRYKAMLLYIDTVVLPKLLPATKIVHLWSFGDPPDCKYRDPVSFLPENLRYHYTWSTGIEVRPALMAIAVEGHRSTEELNDRPNHLITQEKNNRVFELVKNAIDSQ